MTGLLKPAKGVTFREIDSEVVILDMNQGRYFALNPTASFIWHCLVTPRQGRSIPEDYAERFSVPAEIAHKDYEALKGALLSRGFLVPV